MPRTTVDLDASVLRQAKRLARATGKSLSKVISELLAKALAERDAEMAAPTFAWQAKSMRARVDLEDKEATHAALDR